MAKFEMTLPSDILKSFEKIEKESTAIFGAMVKAGAEVVINNVKANMRKSFKDSQNLEKCLKLTKVYQTKSDHAINCKVGFYGYIQKNENYVRRVKSSSGKKATHVYKYEGVPAAMVAMAREFGTSDRYTLSGAYRGSEAKKPFFRSAWKKAEIEQAMLKAQKEASGGLLDDE